MAQEYFLGSRMAAFCGSVSKCLWTSKTHEVNLDYLQFLCETGITGFTLMMIRILVMVRSSSICRTDDGEENKRRCYTVDCVFCSICPDFYHDLWVYRGSVL